MAAVIVVHLFGRAADTRSLTRVCADAGALLVEDAAQAIGAATSDGPVGAQGAAGCFSFYPTKNIGGAGEGGLIVTNDDKRAALLRRLRAHGLDTSTGVHTECGFNARMDELQAAYLNAKLEHLDAWTYARARRAARYLQRLAPLAAAGKLVTPAPASGRANVWHQFVVRITRDRDGVRARLAARGIDARVFYPVPLHLQPCFADLGARTGMLPVCERIANEVLSLPLFASIEDSAIDEVCDVLTAALAD